jgi:hypothetical protein
MFLIKPSCLVIGKKLNECYMGKERDALADIENNLE